MKVIVAHPGKQHSFQTAQALKRTDDLFAYITTIYDKPGSLTNFLNRCILKGDAKKKGSSRRCEALQDNEVVQFCELRSLLNLFSSKIKLPRKIKVWMNDSMADSFGRKVARYAIKNNVDAVIMYDCTSNSCFEMLKERAPNIKRILDVSISHRAFLKDTYEKDIALTGSTCVKEENLFLWNDHNMSRYLNEVKLAQCFLVASKVVSQSIQEHGGNERKIYRIPYGVNSKRFDYQKKKIPTKPMKMLYVGQVNHRKGIHHLFHVMERFSEDDICVKLAGSIDKSSELYAQYACKKNIEFCGFVTPDRLAKLYKESDVFVFPTIGEGFGLVVLEALSCGVPVIITNLAGGNDAITTGVNGIEYDALNEDELEKAIRWFLDHPEKLPEMSEAARRTAEQYTWERYYEQVSEAVNDIVGRKENEK